MATPTPEHELPPAVREMLATQPFEGIEPSEFEIRLATQVATGAMSEEAAVAEALAAALASE